MRRTFYVPKVPTVALHTLQTMCSLKMLNRDIVGDTAITGGFGLDAQSQKEKNKT